MQTKCEMGTMAQCPLHKFHTLPRLLPVPPRHPTSAYRSMQKVDARAAGRLFSLMIAS